MIFLLPHPFVYEISNRFVHAYKIAMSAGEKKEGGGGGGGVVLFPIHLFVVRNEKTQWDWQKRRLKYIKVMKKY